MSGKQDKIAIEVAYASTSKQHIIPMQVPDGCSIRQAILLSGIMQEYPELDLDSLNVGIFSKQRSLDWVVNEGDRIEIYRDLFLEPKLARLQRAKKHKLNKIKTQQK